MHILLIHQAFVTLGEPGGTRHYELSRRLAQRGHRVTIIASRVSYLTGAAVTQSPQTETEDFPGGGRVTIRRVFTYSALHKSFVHRVLAFFSFMASSFWAGLGAGGVDLVWGTSPPIFQGFTAWALARLKRAPFLFEVRDLWPAFAVQVGVLKNRTLIRLSEWLERFLYRRADVLLVNSPGFVEHVHQRGARRVELVPNGADPAMFDPFADGAAFRRAHGLEGCFVALYAGAHGMSNDLGVALEAARLLNDRPEIRIVLLGDGKEKPALQEQARAIGLTNVVFVAPVPKTGMAEALAAADVCFAILKPIPLYGTVYPNKLFDYLAAGRATVLAIDGVARRVIEDAQAGLYAPPGDPQALADAFRRLADDPDLRRQMGRNGRSAVEANFDRDKLAERLVEIMEGMATHRSENG
jgi:glycosyltransferase involved in cell wall biosynthesis